MTPEKAALAAREFFGCYSAYLLEQNDPHSGPCNDSHGWSGGGCINLTALLLRVAGEERERAAGVVQSRVKFWRDLSVNLTAQPETRELARVRDEECESIVSAIRQGTEDRDGGGA